MPFLPLAGAVHGVAVSLLLLLLSCSSVAVPGLAPPSTGGNSVSCALCGNSSSTGGSGKVVGDPVFSGLRGQQYQVHGIDGGVYNLVSDSTLQLNSQFTFLSGPRPCPVLPSTQRQSAACFEHDGSYLGNLALRTNIDDRLLVQAGDAASGFDIVELNGELLNVGDRATLDFDDGSNGTVHRISTHELSIVASLYQLDIDNSDSFLNLRSLSIRAGRWPALTREAPHGLLGQTWKLRGAGQGVIEGRVDEYMIEDDDLFGTAFSHNRFVVWS